MPNAGDGTFQDPGAGTFADCNGLWSAIGSTPAAFSKIAGVYFSGAATADRVSCTDAGGCTAISQGCVSAYDPSTGLPDGNPVSLGSGNSYLSCLFIDTASLGGPPPVPGIGLPATASSGSFGSATLSGTKIVFSSWTDY